MASHYEAPIRRPLVIGDGGLYSLLLLLHLDGD